MSRIERITRSTGGTEAVRRAQRLLAVPRVGPRPDRDPEEREERDGDDAPERRSPPLRSPDGHLDVRA